MRDYQESVTTGQTDGRMDRRTPDKVIPMCRYASQGTQKLDIIVMGTITNAPPLSFCVLVTQAWNKGQRHKPPRGISRPYQDEQLVQVWFM